MFARQVLMIALAGGITFPASGSTLTPVSQDRRLHLSATGPVGSDSRDAAAPDFGPFDTSLNSPVVDLNIYQHSSIGLTSLTGRSGGHSYQVMFNPNYSGGGQSTFNVTFELAQPIEFTFSGLLLASYWASADVSLDGVYAASAPVEGGPVPYSFAGTLSAGTHNLSAHSTVSVPGGPYYVESWTDFGFYLVPEPTGTALIILGGLTLLRHRHQRAVAR